MLPGVLVLVCRKKRKPGGQILILTTADCRGVVSVKKKKARPPLKVPGSPSGTGTGTTFLD
jgi:hypothetical protein